MMLLQKSRQIWKLIRFTQPVKKILTYVMANLKTNTHRLSSQSQTYNRKLQSLNSLKVKMLIWLKKLIKSLLNYSQKMTVLSLTMHLKEHWLKQRCRTLTIWSLSWKKSIRTVLSLTKTARLNQSTLCLMI